MNILHIDSSPRTSTSISRQLSSYLVQSLAGDQVQYLDLGQQPLPPLAGADLIAIHGSTGQGTADLDTHQQLSNTLIEQLKWADTLVLGTPMHNFSTPAVLKRWIDYVARAGITFRYTENGPEGLTGIRNAYIVIATGGAPIGSAMDHLSGYLRTICGFIGVENTHIIDASGSQRDPDAILSRARGDIDQLLATA